MHTSIGGALTVILYFLVILLGVIFSSAQTAAIFSYQDYSECLDSIFLVVEQTDRISLASFSDLQCDARDQSCESCLNSFVIRRSVSVYPLYF